MNNLLDWLWKVPGHRLVPLFAVTNERIVQTKESGPSKRRLLCRSPEMEAAIIDLVDAGVAQEGWQGLLYVMGWGSKSNFRPLYIGKAERKGVRHDLSANLANIRSNRHKFARWGDGSDYHIGDLSHAMFGFKVYRPPHRKYKRWAEALFEQFDPPRLREEVSLFVAPWAAASVGPSGLVGSLPAVEKEVIALAYGQFAGHLLNVDGV